LDEGQTGSNPPGQKRLVGEESGFLTKTGDYTHNRIVGAMAMFHQQPH
jgi:hypothetical protein